MLAEGEGREVAVWGSKHSSSTRVGAGAEFCVLEGFWCSYLVIILVMA
jgi:hypothetical protein